MLPSMTTPGAASGWQARALEALLRGDALATLAAVEGSSDPHAFVLRAYALAQRGEHSSARASLRRAQEGFSASKQEPHAVKAHLAEAEVALLEHDLAFTQRKLGPLVKVLREAGDSTNAAWGLLLQARAALLDGEPALASKLLGEARTETRGKAAARLEAVVALAEAEHAARHLAIGDAHVAASRAWAAAHRAKEAALAQAVERFEESLDTPVARLADGTLLDLAMVAEMVATPRRIVLDARGAKVFSSGRLLLDLGTRPVLFDLLVVLASHASSFPPSRELPRAFARGPANARRGRLRAALSTLERLSKSGLGELVESDGAARWIPPFPVLPIHVSGPVVEARLEALLADGRTRSAEKMATAIGETLPVTRRALMTMCEDGRLHRLRKNGADRFAAASSASQIATWMLFA